jgi:restriction system protein
MVRHGREGEFEEMALEHGLAIVRFGDFPELGEAKSFEDVLAMCREGDGSGGNRAARMRAGQLWTFAHVIAVGDIVVMPRKGSPFLAIGKVTGRYEHRDISGTKYHVRPVQWVRVDVPRTTLQQDILNSLGSIMTVCRLERNDAARRIAEVLAGRPDPGTAEAAPAPRAGKDVEPAPPSASEAAIDLAQVAGDQVVRFIEERFHGHPLSRLVEAVLRAEGWTTRNSPPGPDGGVDILAGRGSLGLDPPRLCVQVKSQGSAADVTVYRSLLGTMRTFGAEQGLLVCWGGFTRATEAEARQGHFTVRLWNQRDLVEAIYRTYERLPEEIQAELPLRRIWALVPEEL